MFTATVSKLVLPPACRQLVSGWLAVLLALTILAAAPAFTGGTGAALAKPDPEEAAIAALCGEDAAVAEDDLTLGESVEVTITLDAVEGDAAARDSDKEQDVDCRAVAEELARWQLDPAGCAVLGRGEQIVAVASGCFDPPSAGERPVHCTIRARAAIIGTAGFEGSSIFVEAICYDVFSEARATVPRGGGLDKKVGLEAHADAKATCKIKVTLRGSGGTFVAWAGRCW